MKRVLYLCALTGIFIVNVKAQSITGTVKEAKTGGLGGVGFNVLEAY